MNNEIFTVMPDGLLDKLQSEEAIIEKERRKAAYIYRPYEIAKQERFSHKQLKEIQVEWDIEGSIEKQFGEAHKIYGKVMSRIDNILNDTFNGVVFQNIDFSTTDENYKLRLPLTEFLKKFNQEERTQFLQYRDDLSKPIALLEFKKKRFKEYKFLTFLLEGTLKKSLSEKQMNVLIHGKFWSEEKRKEWVSVLNEPEECEKMILTIEINKTMYEVVEKFLQRKDRHIGRQGVQKTLRDLPFELHKHFIDHKIFLLNSYTNEYPFSAESQDDLEEFSALIFPEQNAKKIYSKLKSFEYKDAIRTGFEHIIDVYERGKQNRKKDHIDYKDEPFNIVFPDPRGGENIKFMFVVFIWNRILKQAGYPLILEVYKIGKAYHFLKGIIRG